MTSSFKRIRRRGSGGSQRSTYAWKIDGNGHSNGNGKDCGGCSAHRSDSVMPIMLLHARIWLHILVCCPAPGPPMCLIVLPMSSRYGAAFNMASSVPPHMMDSVPALAPTSPPETGASIAKHPAAAAASAMVTARLGVEVVISTRSPPGFRLASTPSEPSVTDSTSAGVPTIVKTCARYRIECGVSSSLLLPTWHSCF